MKILKPSSQLVIVALTFVLAFSSNAKQPSDGSTKLDARFTGFARLDGNLATDATVDIVASGPGQVKRLGTLTNTDLRWTVRRDVVLGLLSGTVKEAPLNTGTLVAETESGAQIEGLFMATVKKRGRWFFEVEGTFQITGGSHELTGITGSGALRGTLDLRDASYTGSINGKVTLPD